MSVKNENVVIYDDMIRSGSSLVQAAQAYKAAGASEISALTTHGLFTAGALERLKQTGLFKKIVCTDSHSEALKYNDPFLEVISVSEIFASAVLGK